MKKMILGALFCSLAFSDSLNDIQKSKTIRIGVYESEPPFSKKTDSDYEGFEAELAQSLGSTIVGDGGKIELVPITSDDLRLKYLKENRIDMAVASVSVTEQRRQEVEFSMPYFSASLGLLTTKNSNIKNLDNIKQSTIGAITGSTGEEFLVKNGIKSVQCSGSRECYQKVKSGEIDGYLDDNLYVMTYPILDNDVKVDLKNLGESVFLAVAVQKGNKDLVEAINKQLAMLNKSGFFKKAYNDTFEPFYKGTADKKYFLLDDLYNFL